jgi:DNA mismatch endonuclease (patch repair protein)
MVDVLDSAARSELMRRIRSHGNKSTELKIIEVFRANAITGWRRKQKLYGKPDFVFRKSKVCVFVDGCFWHGCPKCYRSPSSNVGYWSGKIQRNKVRDRLVSRTLRGDGWHVLRIWEHQLADKSHKRLLRRLRDALGEASSA